MPPRRSSARTTTPVPTVDDLRPGAGATTAASLPTPTATGPIPETQPGPADEARHPAAPPSAPPPAVDEAAATAAYRRLGGEPAVGPPQTERIRALFAELLGYPAGEVRDALGVTAAVLAPPAPANPDEQRVADDIAAGLTQLGWLVRRHPRLGAGLRWELSGLSPAMIVARDELDVILATARTVGATIGAARYAEASPDTTGTVVELGGAVRLLLTSPRPVIDASPVAM